MNEFTAGSCIRFGWDTFWKRPWFLIGIPLLVLIVYGIVLGALNEVANFGFALAIIVFIINFWVSTVYQMGSTNFTLKAVDDVSTVKLEDYWHPHPFWSFFGAGILVGLCVLGAVIAAAIPAGIVGAIIYVIAGSGPGGVIGFAFFLLLVVIFIFMIALMFAFARYLVIWRGITAMKALKESARITKGHRWGLLGLVGLCLLINVIGLICLVVGLLVTIPVSSLAIVRAYRLLEQQAGTPVGA